MQIRHAVRQGDVLLIPVDDEIPATARHAPRKDGRLILARGEATGHHHSILEADVDLFTLTDGTDTAAGADMLLRVRSRAGAVLTHQEHDPIALPPGTYRVRRPREYSPQAAPRLVAD
jgi:hypothetical protein